MKSSNSKPYGNSRSLVPEIRNMGGPGSAQVKPCNPGPAPKIGHFTNVKNNVVQTSSKTGKS